MLWHWMWVHPTRRIGSSSAGPPPSISSHRTSTEQVQDSSSKLSPSDPLILLGTSMSSVTLALTKIFPLRASSFSQLMILPHLEMAAAMSSVLQKSNGTPMNSNQQVLLKLTLRQFLPSLCLVKEINTSPNACGLCLMSPSLSLTCKNWM